jgi:hypothetical protein
MPQKIKRSKRFIGRKVIAVHPKSGYFGRTGTIIGFRGGQSKDNPYVTVSFNGFVETISAKWLKLGD